MIPIVKRYEKLDIDINEILHYAGGNKESARESAEIMSILDECIKLTLPYIDPKLCYCTLDADAIAGFSAYAADDSAFAKYMSGCSSAILFAASVGYGADRLVARYESLSVAKAHMINAIAAQQVEAICNCFCREIRKDYPGAKPRFSPGFGGLSLQSQRMIFDILDCQRKIGISLGEGLLISPSKSVTAFIAIAD